MPATKRRLRPAISPALFLTNLVRLTPTQRLEAFRRGEFNAHQRSIWASHYPEEVPTLNGEFEWIVRDLADCD